jgi:hypothetical protein
MIMIAMSQNNKLHYKMNSLFATYIYIAKGQYMHWWGLYQHTYYVFLKVALQRSIATLIYVLVTPTNKRCKVAMDIDRLWQHLYAFVPTTDKLLLLTIISI